MPSFATVATEIRCPRCNSALPGHLVGFQWGYSSVPLGTSIALYQVGDPVRWRLDHTGVVPAWSYFQAGTGGNIGDPAYADLLIRESELFGQRCLSCAYGYVDVGVVIRGGVIHEVRAFTDGLPECDISLIGSAGKITPKPEWNEQPMTIVDGGDSEQLVPHPQLLTRARKRS